MTGLGQGLTLVVYHRRL